MGELCPMMNSYPTQSVFPSHPLYSCDSSWTHINTDQDRLGTKDYNKVKSHGLFEIKMQDTYIYTFLQDVLLKEKEAQPSWTELEFSQFDPYKRYKSNGCSLNLHYW